MQKSPGIVEVIIEKIEIDVFAEVCGKQSTA